MNTLYKTEPRVTVVAGVPGSGIDTWLRVGRDGNELPSRFYDQDRLADGLGGWDHTATRRRATELMTA